MSWDEEPYVPFVGDDYRPPTVGLVIDKFLALSDQDKAVFLRIIGGYGYVVPVGPNGPQPAPGYQPPTAPAVNLANLANQPVAPGYTRDPATGKIYRAQAPKERPEEFLELQEEYDQVRSDLADEMSAQRYKYNVKTSETLDDNDQQVADDVLPERIKELREKLERAKQALKQYKTDNPGLFRKEAKRASRKGRPIKVVPTVGVDRQGQASGKKPS